MRANRSRLTLAIVNCLGAMTAFLCLAAWAPALGAQQIDPWDATAGNPFFPATAVTPWDSWYYEPCWFTQIATNSTDNSAPPGFESRPAIEEAAEGQGQNWNWHIQNTDIIQGYPRFAARYSGPNSLPSGGQTRETVSVDLYAGVRLWRGAEAHLDILMWQGFGLDNTLGIDAFPNGEAYKVGTRVPNLDIARLFIQQTIGLGGEDENVADDQLTLAGNQDISRLTLTIGRFSAKDIFDNNAYANDSRGPVSVFGTRLHWEF